jgi:exodeoxyribonuclease VII large subunit
MERRRLSLERLAHNRAFTLTPNRIRDLQQRFDESTLKMLQAIRRYTADLRHRERMLDTRLRKMDLRSLIVHKKEILQHVRLGMAAKIRTQLQFRRSRFEIAVGKTDALSPLAILKRGFALCRDSRGVIIKKAANVSPGDSVQVTLASGELTCNVNKVTDS